MLPCFKFTMPLLSAYSLLLFTYAQVASGGLSFYTFWLTLPVSWCHNQRRLLQLQVSGISFSGYHWLPSDSSSFDLKNWMPLDVLVTDTLYSISKVRQKTNFWSVFLLSKSLLPTLSILTLPIGLGFIKISYQVFIDSYQDFADIRLLILL